MKHISISHSIFLTAQEIKNLKSKPTTVETIGISVPSDESKVDLKVDEIFCRYQISNEIIGNEIEMTDDGYKFYITDTSKWNKIDHTPEEINWLNYSIETVLEKNNEKFFVTNHIVIQDIQELERSTFCEGLAQYLNKTNSK